MRPVIGTLIVLLVFLLLSPAMASAHSPVDPEEGKSLGTATHVDDPAKSWAIYGRLEEGGDTWYFEVDLDAGDRLYLSLLSTTEGFVPTLVVMGPGLGEVGQVPEGVELPEGAGWVVLEGEGTDAEFEPFTPGSYYHVAEYDEEVDDGGTYIVAIHSADDGGPFSLAVGYLESFTVIEWLSLPVSLMGIYRWEGQSWAVILGPAIAVIVAGLTLLMWQRRKKDEDLTLFQWTSAVSGILILAWSAMVLTQMAMALGRSGWQSSAVVTLMFAGASIAMGLYALVPAFKGPAVPDGGRRAGMVLVGVLAFFLYSGLYVGPLMALVSALIPDAVAARTLPRAGTL